VPADRLAFGDYLKEAFKRRFRLPLLGHLPLNYLGIGAFGVLGLANFGFWLLGAASELVYLVLMSSNPRFQALVEKERMLAAKETFEERVARVVARLSPGSRTRYEALLEECRAVLGISERLDEEGLAAMRKMRTGGLNQMLWIFLRLLASREVLEANVRRLDRKAVEKEIADLERQIEQTAAESALARSLRGTLDIQQRRLENFDRAKESLLVIDAELRRIEQHVVLVREESAVSGKAEVLSHRLDAVSGALSETNRWMEQNARIFGELGADPLGSAPADLPELPPPIPEAGSTRGAAT
jgi:hypothetical protein